MVSKLVEEGVTTYLAARRLKRASLSKSPTDPGMAMMDSEIRIETMKKYE